LTARQLLPALPISALGFLCPVTAAAILVHRETGWAGVAALLKRSFDFGRIQSKGWLAPLLLLQPGIMLMSFVVMRLAGVSVPVPHIALIPALALFAVFFIGGLGEELGWSGYATDPLEDRFGALRASLIIGLVWAVWHFIGLAQAHRSLEFIAWWSLGTLSYRVIIVWLYNNTGRSVFVAAVFHAMINLTWQLFPVDGSFYDPRITGLIAAAVAVVITIVWGPRTLTRPGSASLGQPG
jgi:membrane protease YdiL (CAAX protease family)